MEVRAAGCRDPWLVMSKVCARSQSCVGASEAGRGPEAVRGGKWLHGATRVLPLFPFTLSLDASSKATAVHVLSRRPLQLTASYARGQAAGGAIETGIDPGRRDLIRNRPTRPRGAGGCRRACGLGRGGQEGRGQREALLQLLRGRDAYETCACARAHRTCAYTCAACMGMCTCSCMHT